jgi:hypothetical protein
MQELTTERELLQGWVVIERKDPSGPHALVNEPQPNRQKPTVRTQCRRRQQAAPSQLTKENDVPFVHEKIGEARFP